MRSGKVGTVPRRIVFLDGSEASRRISSRPIKSFPDSDMSPGRKVAVPRNGKAYLPVSAKGIVGRDTAQCWCGKLVEQLSDNATFESHPIGFGLSLEC